MCTSVYTQARNLCLIFFSTVFYIFWRQGLSPNLELMDSARLAGWQAPPNHTIPGLHEIMLGFFIDAGDSS